MTAELTLEKLVNVRKDQFNLLNEVSTEFLFYFILEICCVKRREIQDALHEKVDVLYKMMTEIHDSREIRTVFERKCVMCLSNVSRSISRNLSRNVYYTQQKFREICPLDGYV